MVLLLLFADHHSLHNNIVITCVMSCTNKLEIAILKRNAMKTRQENGNIPSVSYYTLSPHTPLRLQCYMHCKFYVRHLYCSPYCVRRARVRSMQWTPLTVQSKRVSTPNQMRAGQEPVTTNTLRGMPRVAHVAAMPIWLVGCSQLFENLVRKLFPCLVYSTG